MQVFLPELTEEVLTYHVDAHVDDPAYQWATLRKLSAFQKRRIERHFHDFWLPKLSISIYSSVSWSLDYNYEKSGTTEGEDGFVTFQHNSDQLRKWNVEDEFFGTLWAHHNINDPKAILRLGEGFLNCGMRGGYIINDSELPGLKIVDYGKSIVFKWKEALNALFREEMLLRNLRSSMLQAAQLEWKKSQHQDYNIEASNTVLLRFLVLDIQMASRVAVLRHRVAKQDPSGQTKPNFNEWSGSFHCQTPTRRMAESETGGCFCCSRLSGPDIFEIVQQEESMVLALPGWQNLNNEDLLDLYAEEFGWACCIVHGKRDSTTLQQQRKAGWKGSADNAERVTGLLKSQDRYDPLG